MQTNRSSVVRANLQKCSIADKKKAAENHDTLHRTASLGFIWGNDASHTRESVVPIVVHIPVGESGIAEGNTVMLGQRSRSLTGTQRGFPHSYLPMLEIYIKTGGLSLDVSGFEFASDLYRHMEREGCLQVG
jgi:hypothetical protein